MSRSIRFFEPIPVRPKVQHSLDVPDDFVGSVLRALLDSGNPYKVENVEVHPLVHVCNIGFICPAECDVAELLSGCGFVVEKK